MYVQYFVVVPLPPHSAGFRCRVAIVAIVVVLLLVGLLSMLFEFNR